MPLRSASHGKSRVRVLRLSRDGAMHEAREASVDVTLHGGAERAFTHADNRTAVATDTIRNIVNIVARENVAAPAGVFCQRIAERLLDRYPQIGRVSVRSEETRWIRLDVQGAPHPHAFVLDANGRGVVTLEQSRAGAEMHSGVAGFTFMKTTGSGWADYVLDDYTTLPQTDDRIAATSMDALWLWSALPEDPGAVNAVILRTMLEVFATTYSHSLQDSLRRMAEAALAAVPDVAEIALSCPNKHYLAIDLSRFGVPSDKSVFTPTEEPHGQIECVVRR